MKLICSSIHSLGHVDQSKSEQTKKVKEQFERKINDMTNELKKFKAAQKEHEKLVRNQSHYEKQLKTLQHELGEMKKTKVGVEAPLYKIFDT